MSESPAHIEKILLEPLGRYGEVIMAVQFDRSVEIPGKREFGFTLRRCDVESLHRALSDVLARNRIIIPPSQKSVR